MMFFKVLLLAASLEFGAVQGSAFNYAGPYPEQMMRNDVALYTALNADVSYHGFYLGGGMRNFFTPETLVNYVPFQMDFTFEAGYRAGAFQIGYEHTCFHPMQPYATFIEQEIKPKYEGGYNKIFVRIQTP